MKKLISLLTLLVLPLLVFAGGLAGHPLPAPELLLPASEFPGAPPLFGAAGLIVNTANLGIIFTGFQTAFNTGFRNVEATWERIATMVPSSTSKEVYGWLGQFPKLREWIGDRHIKGMEAHDYTIKNKKFESTVGIPRDTIDDDSFGVFTPFVEEMGFAAATHPDELVWDLLSKGFTELAYDGQFFFDTDHPVAGASVSNLQAGGGDPWYLLDVRRPLKPLIFQRRRPYDFKSLTGMDDEGVFMRDEYRYGVDARANVGFGFWQQARASQLALDQANFDAAIQSMMELKSDEGRPLGINPNLLVVGPSNRASAKVVVEKELINQGESNPNFKAVEVLVVPWLV